MHRILLLIAGLLVPASLAGTLLMAPAASASTAPLPAMVQCQLPIVNGQYLGPFIGQPGATGARTITRCQFKVFLTNDGPVVQVFSPFDGGRNPMYHLNAIARPPASALERKPIPMVNARTMQCSIVERTLVPGFVARWPHVRCGIQFRQRVPHYLGSALRLAYGQLVNFYAVGKVLAHATTKIPVKVFP